MKLMKIVTVMGVVAVLAGPALALQPNAAALLAVKKLDAVTVVPEITKISIATRFRFGTGGSCFYCFRDNGDGK